MLIHIKILRYVWHVICFRKVAHTNGYVGNLKESMMFNIEDTFDIAKLVGAIRLMAKGKFKVNKELLDEVLTYLHRVAKERGIGIKIVTPSGEKVIEFTATGVIVGAMLGFYIGQISGALIGAIVGGFTGYCAAHMTIVMDRSDDTDHLIFQIA